MHVALTPDLLRFAQKRACPSRSKPRCLSRNQPKSAVPGLLPCCRSRLLAIDILETRSFATQTAQVVQLGAANLGRANQFDSVDYPRVLGENSFHPLPETDLAHGEAGLWSTGTS